MEYKTAAINARDHIILANFGIVTFLESCNHCGSQDIDWQYQPPAANRMALKNIDCGSNCTTMLSLNTQVGPQADLWAIACILYQLMTIEVPFPGSCPGDVLTSMARSPLPRGRPTPFHCRGKFSKEIRKLVYNSLREKIEERLAIDDLKRTLNLEISEIDLLAMVKKRNIDGVKKTLDSLSKADAEKVVNTVRGANGKTGMMLAAEMGDMKLISTLFRYQPNLDIKSHAGWTAYDYSKTETIADKLKPAVSAPEPLRLKRMNVTK